MVETSSDIKKILVGVDNSDDAQKAFRYAINRAKELNAQLQIVTVLEKHDMNVYQVLDDDFIHGRREDVESHVQGYIETAQKAGVQDVKGIISEGNPGETIVKDVIPKYQPDLLVIGSLDIKKPHKLFGSQAAHMAQNSPISVLVIR
ncbi:universal stress protein [Lactobacillus sp. DCY120]|uniref:Universal stress protein n=1 Tax=Bombilactobacillus apium TaxID=2675299 RepID=A0A850R0N5_9LACO|nr:universal stress protein [Bombilactobacillus apium]NVY96473.1 universal stress protein [Bombilactobacillus apium]